MNCWFCARDGVASAATPTSDASVIPTCFPFIGSSIDTRKRLGAARGCGFRPWVGVSSAASTAHGGSRRGRERAGGPNVFRPHQRPWPPQALTFKLKMRKPREQLYVIGIAIRQQEDLSPS